MKPLGRGGEGGEDGLVVEAVLFRDNVLRLDDLEDIELALELGLLRCAIAKEAYKNHSIATQRNSCMAGHERQVELSWGPFSAQSSSIERAGYEGTMYRRVRRADSSIFPRSRAVYKLAVGNLLSVEEVAVYHAAL